MIKICKADNCNRPILGNLDYCKRHYEQVRKYGRLTPELEKNINRAIKFCSIDGCDSAVHAKGLCKKHYDKLCYYETHLYKEPKLENKCNIEECDNKHYAKGYCKKHYRIYIRNPIMKEERKLIQEKLFVEDVKHISMRKMFEYIVEKYDIDIEKETKEYWNEKSFEKLL